MTMPKRISGTPMIGRLTMVVTIPAINIAEPMNINVFSNREGIVRGPRDQRLYHFLKVTR